MRELATKLSKAVEDAVPKEPTKEGKLRWPPDGYYTANGENVPCSCTSSCPLACKGKCGCHACAQSYADFGLGDFQ